MKTYPTCARFAALPLALATAFPSLAQTKDSLQLQEMVITATRNSQLLGAAVPHTTVISREDIERSQATNLVTLLEREAGLQRTQNGGIGTVSSVFLRGAPSLQTLILIDGVPQNKQDASGAVSLEHVMLDHVERVEIVRGNVSAIYGSGAIGGVIQIFTKVGSREPSVALSLELGPRASRKLAGSVSATLGNTVISADVARLTTDGFSAIDASQQASANPDADSYKNTTANLTLTHRLSRDHSFGVKAMHTTGDSAFDNAFGAPSDSQTSTTRVSQTTVFSDNTWGHWRSRVSLSEQSDKSRSQDNGAYGSEDGFTSQATLLNWVNTVALGDQWRATAGLEAQRQRVQTTSSVYTAYDKERNARSVFAGVEGKVGRGDLQVNVRHDNVGGRQETTGYLGYGYAVAEAFKLIASSSTAFNAAPLGYLFAPGYGNPLLRPERARSAELGMQYEQGAQLLRVTYFDTRIHDQLNYSYPKFQNIGRTGNSGVELSYRGRVGAADVRASLTQQDPVDEMTGLALIRRARTMASLGLSQAIGAWRVGADLRYSGERPDAYFDMNTFSSVKTTLAAYSVLDVLLSYRISQELMLKVRLDNVTDQKYQTVFAYNQQPRSLYLGVSWTPKL